MAGMVTVDGVVETKSGQKFDTDSDIAVKEKALKYVSRGGLKLEKAIESFDINLEGIYAVDMGASTGGFTDCMLINGAKKVYALDVGYGQLDYKLRVDPRVVNMEKTNIRYLDTDLIKEPIDFISIDVSFISLKHMFPVAVEILGENGAVICLIKPQFEAGREQVGKKGIVKNSKVHIEVIEKVLDYALLNGLYPHGLDFSPVKGTKGNIEYLLYLKKNKNNAIKISPESVVTAAHLDLDN